MHYAHWTDHIIFLFSTTNENGFLVSVPAKLYDVSQLTNVACVGDLKNYYLTEMSNEHFNACLAHSLYFILPNKHAGLELACTHGRGDLSFLT